MRVLILHRKKLGITLILIGLMVVIFAVAKGFSENIKSTALTENSITSLKSYTVENFKVQYKLPSEWTTKLRDLNSDDNVYHNDFLSDDAKIHGYVEVWNSKEDLSAFISDNKVVSDKGYVINDYDLKPISINDFAGYFVTYKSKSTMSTNYVCNEYFAKVSGKVLKFSFSTRESNYNDNIKSAFKVIADTIKENK